jgi:hypothetical protein
MAQTGAVTGRVQTAEKMVPLEDANVVLIESDLGLTTEADGRHLMTNVPPGTHRLRASFVGYVRTAVEEKGSDENC